MSYHLLAEAFDARSWIATRSSAIRRSCRSPSHELTSKAYAREAARVDRRRRARADGRVQSRTAARAVNTTHYSVVDEHGNAVATTTTLNDLYGSGVYVAAAGFFLNDEMDDFAARPGRPNMYGLVQGEQNAIVPGKRMLSAMSPTIVLDPKGDLLLVVGSRGGPRIITSVAQVILNVIDHHMSFDDAMSEPRIHHQAWPDMLHYEPNGLSAATVDSLRAMGHRIAAAPFEPGRLHRTRNSGGKSRGRLGGRGGSPNEWRRGGLLAPRYARRGQMPAGRTPDRYYSL